MNKSAFSIISFVLCFMPLLTFAHIEDRANLKISETEIIINYENQGGNKTLSLKLISETDDGSIPLINTGVVLYYLHEDQNIKITDLITGSDGIVEYILKDDNSSYKNEEGIITWIVRYEGNENFESSETSLEIIDVEMKIRFSEIDSVKSIVTSVFELDSNNERKPSEELDVYFFTPSLFGLLPIGEGWVENGECIMEFPTDIPGDETGNLNIIAKILENELYGDVISENNINWGKKLEIPEISHRELWTSDPPIWMMLALLFLLTAVWSHYYFVFYKLNKIRKTGKQKE